jgi:aryl-alcohol dehydrogenase-like predicted oxidoreductase
MEYVRLGTTGLEISPVCLGTMTFGNEADEGTSRALMQDAVERGINFFDCAHNYNKGADGGNRGTLDTAPHRDEIILTTKVFFPFRRRQKRPGAFPAQHHCVGGTLPETAANRPRRNSVSPPLG